MFIAAEWRDGIKIAVFLLHELSAHVQENSGGRISRAIRTRPRCAFHNVDSPPRKKAGVNLVFFIS